jgi:hypothetical protein
MATPDRERIERLNDFSARARAGLALIPGADTEARLRAEAAGSGDPDWGQALAYLLQNRASVPAPPPDATGGAGFHAELRSLLESHGSYSPQVAEHLASGQSQFPQAYPDALRLVQTWRDNQPPRPDEPVPDLPPPPKPSAVQAAAPVAAKGGMTLAVALLLGYVATNSNEVGDFLQTHLIARLPFVWTPWSVVAAVGVAGALGGLLNGWLTYSGFVAPQFTTVDGSRVFMPGFLGNLLVGAAAAAGTIGLVATPAPSPGDGSAPAVTAPAPQAGATPRPTGFALVSAFVAGLGGAKLMSLWRDRALVSRLAGDYATAPAQPTPPPKVITGAEALQALRRLAAFAAKPTQPAAVGPMPADPEDRLALVRSSVRKLLDRGGTADLFAQQKATGQPAAINRDGSNIDMGVLALDHPPSPALAKELQKLRVGPVVATSLKAFTDLMPKNIDVAAEAAAIGDAWNTANSLMSWLSQAPAGWQLTPDQLG